MIYADVRSSIRTGDLIAVKKRSGFLPVATRIVTGSPYTHTGIAVWAGGRLLLAETNAGGCCVAPLSQEAPYDFDVFDCPIANRNIVEAMIWNMLGTRIPYGYVDLARIAGYKLFAIPLPKQDGSDLVCSALSAKIYIESGWAPVGLPSIPWPGAVADALKDNLKFVVTGSDYEEPTQVT
jgi:hypothetical protein